MRSNVQIWVARGEVGLEYICQISDMTKLIVALEIFGLAVYLPLFNLIFLAAIFTKNNKRIEAVNKRKSFTSLTVL